MRSLSVRVLVLFAFVLVLGGGGLAFGDGDVWAQGISVVDAGGGLYQVFVTYGAAWESTQGEFSYSLILTHKRDGQVVDVPINLSETVHPIDACADACGGQCNSGESCHYTLGKDPTIHEGSCGVASKVCPLDAKEKTESGCTCRRSGGGAGSSPLRLIMGDTLTLSITPSPGFNEGDRDNNTLTVTVQ